MDSFASSLTDYFQPPLAHYAPQGFAPGRSGMIPPSAMHMPMYPYTQNPHGKRYSLDIQSGYCYCALNNF
jgi:hypothetical protein